jgi:hypothetical protein
MSKPPLSLQKPAASKVTFVSENSGVAIYPVVVVGSVRKVRIINPLLIGDAARIATVKTTGIEIECQQLVLVRPVAQIEISLP